MKRMLCALLALVTLLALCACGDGGYKVKRIETLVEQSYSLAFRNDDWITAYVTGAIEELSAEGTVRELNRKWFGQDLVSFDKKADALQALPDPGEHVLLMGVDINSFPMAYLSGDLYWGFDVELGNFVCDKLGWTLQIIPIEKENVYVELYSGNIDVAWGGVALSDKELAAGKYTQYGPYVKNDIVIVARDGSRVRNSMQLRGKNLAMPTTEEARGALDSNAKLVERLGQITRLPGGTTECFSYLYDGSCDAVLTDSTAMYYFNSH